MIVKGGFVHVAFALIKRITIVSYDCVDYSNSVVEDSFFYLKSFS